MIVITYLYPQLIFVCEGIPNCCGHVRVQRFWYLDLLSLLYELSSVFMRPLNLESLKCPQQALPPQHIISLIARPLNGFCADRKFSRILLGPCRDYRCHQIGSLTKSQQLTKTQGATRHLSGKPCQVLKLLFFFFLEKMVSLKFVRKGT